MCEKIGPPFVEITLKVFQDHINNTNSNIAFVRTWHFKLLKKKEKEKS